MLKKFMCFLLPELIQLVLTVLVIRLRVRLMPGPGFVQEPWGVPLHWDLLHGQFDQILGFAAPSSPAARARTGCTYTRGTHRSCLCNKEFAELSLRIFCMISLETTVVS